MLLSHFPGCSSSSTFRMTPCYVVQFWQLTMCVGTRRHRTHRQRLHDKLSPDGQNRNTSKTEENWGKKQISGKCSSHSNSENWSERSQTCEASDERSGASRNGCVQLGSGPRWIHHGRQKRKGLLVCYVLDNDYSTCIVSCRSSDDCCTGWWLSIQSSNSDGSFWPLIDTCSVAQYTGLGSGVYFVVLTSVPDCPAGMQYGEFTKPPADVDCDTKTWIGHKKHSLASLSITSLQLREKVHPRQSKGHSRRKGEWVTCVVARVSFTDWMGALFSNRNILI